MDGQISRCVTAASLQSSYLLLLWHTDFIAITFASSSRKWLTAKLSLYNRRTLTEASLLQKQENTCPLQTAVADLKHGRRTRMGMTCWQGPKLNGGENTIGSVSGAQKGTQKQLRLVLQSCPCIGACHWGIIVMMFISCVASRIYGSNLSQMSILFRISHICPCVFVSECLFPQPASTQGDTMGHFRIGGI